MARWGHPCYGSVRGWVYQKQSQRPRRSWVAFGAEAVSGTLLGGLVFDVGHQHTLRMLALGWCHFSAAHPTAGSISLAARSPDWIAPCIQPAQIVV